MAKKAASIRYDELKLELAKKETGQRSLQMIVNYFLDSIWFKHHPPKVFEVISAKIVKEAEGTKAEFNLSIHEQMPNSKINYTAQDWIDEKREIDSSDTTAYQDWIKRLDASNLSRDLKKQIKFA